LALIDRWVPGDAGVGPLTIQGHGVPTALDIPDIDVEFVGRAADHAPFGGLGLGELPVVPVQAAVAGAVEAATGVPIRRFPIRPDVFLAAAGSAR